MSNIYLLSYVYSVVKYTKLNYFNPNNDTINSI